MHSTKHMSVLWSHLVGSTLSELVAIFGDKISLPDVAPVRQLRKGSQVRAEYEPRDRIYNQWRTFWMFLGQVMSWTQSCREAQRKFQVWLWHSEGKEISSNTSGYCQARKRVNPIYLDSINQEITEQHQEQQSHKPSLYLWCGRHVKMTDGSSVSMPDTDANQKLYPQPSAQKKGCGFPVMRIVATFDLASGMMMAYQKGSLAVHERTLWHDTWDSYNENDIALADRGFCSFADYHLLKERGVDSVMRLHQRRKTKKITHKFNKNDYLVQWEKGTRCQKPKWVTMEQWEKIPDHIIVRYIKIAVQIPGIRTKTLTVATTLLDPKKYPADAIADLYRRRWTCETNLKDIKTTMRMKVLRSNTPQMIHKELTVFIIAYNLIRSIMWDAAISHGINPNRISFKGAMTTIIQWAHLIATINEPEEKEKTMEAFKKILTTDIVPNRKNRREPRAIKRRQNTSYQLLTKPRQEFWEIQHRQQYRKDKALS